MVLEEGKVADDLAEVFGVNFALSQGAGGVVSYEFSMTAGRNKTYRSFAWPWVSLSWHA